MFASDVSDVVVAVIVGVSSIIGAALGLYGVVFTVRAQMRPRLMEPIDLDAEREARMIAEARAEAWRRIALHEED